jgi:hypothetical protein
MKWTHKQIEQFRDCVKAGASDTLLASIFQVTEPAIRRARQRFAPFSVKFRTQVHPDFKTAEPFPQAPKQPTTFEQDKEAKSGEFWKREYQVLEKKYEQAVTQASISEQLVELAKEVAPTSYDPCPAQIPSKQAHSDCAQSAVLLLSDTHVGQVITPDQTLGFGGYDLEIFLARLKTVESAITSIVTRHTTTVVDELVVCFGGDLIHGALNHGAEAAQKMTLFDQTYAAGHAFAQFLRNLAPLFPKVRVFGTVGNHPRFANQKRMPTENRYSNLDQFCLSYTRALTERLENVHWTLNRQPTALFKVQGFGFELLHGDTLRGGDRALGIPNHAVGRHISGRAQLFAKHGQQSPDYYLCGHLHRDIVLPHAKGRFIVNGGFPGIDGYALAENFSPVDPTQTFFLMHPKYGQTASYSISLKFAKVEAERPYDLP